MAQSKLIPLFYAPDLDQSWDINPGVLNLVNNYVPTKRGTWVNYANGPTQNMADPGTWAIGTYGTPITGYIFKAVAGGSASARMFVCSAKTHFRILELTSAGVVTDRSKGAVDYSACTNWTMTAAGNAIIAANGVDKLQVSTGGAFADMAGGEPTGAQCLAANLGFILAGNMGDGTNADAWGCSALGNYASWTPSLATQAANGRLLDTPGPIRAMVSLRDAVIAYKDDSIYVGNYIGDTVNGVIWGWQVISDKIGCSSPHGVAVLNNVHYFLHKTGVYAFDGTQVSNIGNGVQRETLRRVADVSALAFAQSGVDEQEGVVYFGFPLGPTGTEVQFTLMLNVNTGRWGGCMSGGTCWHEATLGNGHLYGYLHAGISDLVQWESNSWNVTANGSGPVCIGSNDNGVTGLLRIPQYGVAVVNSTAGDATISTGWLCTGPTMSYLRRWWPRFSFFGTQTNTPSGAIFGQRREADAVGGWSQPPSSGGFSTIGWNANDNAFDSSGSQTANRALRVLMTLRGPHEINGVWVDLESAGSA